MKKNDHSVYVVLRDWSKVRKANNPVVAEKKKAKERRAKWAIDLYLLYVEQSA